MLYGDSLHGQTPPLAMPAQPVVSSWDHEGGPTGAVCAAPVYCSLDGTEWDGEPGQEDWKGAVGKEMDSWLCEGFLDASGELTWMEQNVWSTRAAKQMSQARVRHRKEEGYEGKSCRQFLYSMWSL